LKKGVTVLICTFNGEKNLLPTLQHLAWQKTDPNLEWEILVIDNASQDNTAETALHIWHELKTPIPFSVAHEMRPGKDKAMDMGLSRAKYNYVIVCDDDNWLSDNYVQYAYTIMERDPAIGMLGGQGMPDFEIHPPEWFTGWETFYAVGQQNLFSGELRHYWPRYRFLWGAGAVINLEAYNFLKEAGFDRILTFEKTPRAARSEDMELCFAIWLAGYKIWYDKDLTYRHYIPAVRLKWEYIMKVIKQSIVAVHYLRPYQILLFTGAVHAPQKSFWPRYIVYYLKLFLRAYVSFEGVALLFHLLIGAHLEKKHYLNKAMTWYQFHSVLTLGRGYDTLYKKVLRLQGALLARNKSS
jgi:glycosyltransferase involved in cell wall biosynthesis